MFGLFKKTSWKIDEKTFSFFNQVFMSLPIEFQFLSEGLNKGLYKRFFVTKKMQDSSYAVSFDPKQSDKSMIKGKHFELENIIITQNAQAYQLNLTIYNGLWIGFEIQKSILDFKNFQVDTSSLKKLKSKYAAEEKIEKLVRGLSSEQLDLTNLSEFEIDGNYYYQIKDLEDGNYIAIDKKGQVFGLIHDPYKIQLINKSVKQFVDDTNKGLVDFNKVLN